MPYIRRYLRPSLETIVSPDGPGELNYTLSRICFQYVVRKGASYATYNEVIGALECAKLELYRRQVAEYENQKCRENGDVYCGDAVNDDDTL